MKLDLLPEDCIVQILSFTSPHDASQLCLVSTMIRDAALSDLLWEKFLPSDYWEIIERLVLPIAFSSKKELFLKLFKPLLIDGGSKVRAQCDLLYFYSWCQLTWTMRWFIFFKRIIFLGMKKKVLIFYLKIFFNFLIFSWSRYFLWKTKL